MPESVSAQGIALSAKDCPAPRYPLPDHLIPLTDGRFEGKILVVRLECTGAIPVQHEWTDGKFFCPLGIERPGMPVPPRPPPTIDRNRFLSYEQKIPESSSDFVARIYGRAIAEKRFGLLGTHW